MPAGAILDAMATASRPRVELPASPRRTAVPAPAALILGACGLLVLALRAPYLQVGLNPDEGGVAFIAQHWHGASGTSLYGNYWLDRPPLLLVLYKIAALGGIPGIRALGAVASLSLVGIAYAIGRQLGGLRVAAPAALIAALLTSSAALAAVGTPAELLASIPAAGSIACLLRARARPRSFWWPAAAGALAVTAVLVKQSFLDAGFAGAVFIVLMLVRTRSWRVPVAYTLGALTPVAAVAAWMALGGVRAADLIYALAGFRVDSLHALQNSHTPLLLRLHTLEYPALFSGMVVLGPLAIVGLWRRRGDAVLRATLLAWFAAGTVGVLAGGSYLPHYLIQLAVPSATGCAVLLARARPQIRWGVLGAATVLVVAIAMGAAVGLIAKPAHAKERDIAAYLHRHARPGDTAYALYARANLAYYDEMPSPFPYAWSLMMRAKPGTRAELGRLLASARAPTWIVQWQPPSQWSLDPTGALRRTLHTRYRKVARVGGHPIWHLR